MRYNHFTALATLSLLLGGVLYADSRPAHAATDDAVSSARDETTEEEARAAAGSHLTFLDSITLTTTRGERTVGETAGSVTVIDSQRIERELVGTVEDLVRYEPGVDVAGDADRLGLNGFIIRGLGGNRVLTLVDGVPTSEQFERGPLSVHQFQLDLESLRSVEIVRSASSPLYGSDALGGLVAFTTKRPVDYLAGQRSHLELSTGYRGASSEARVTAIGALGGEHWSGSLLVSSRRGSETDTKGSVATDDFTRTAPNPSDHENRSFVSRVDYRISDSNQLGLALEHFDSEVHTDALSSQGRILSGRFVENVRSVDTQDRWRLSLDQQMQAGAILFDTLTWHAFSQRSKTEQVLTEERVSFGGNVRDRRGLFTFEQQSLGGDLQLRKGLLGSRVSQLLTYGISMQWDDFDMLRDREDTDRGTGQPVRGFSPYPTKYFPESQTTQLGLFFQDEIDLFDGRLRLIPGLRYDDYELDPSRADAVFISGNPGQPSPEKFSDRDLSPKLGVVFDTGATMTLFAQYARGFRAPPYSNVNAGFSNFFLGYATAPNPDLRPETSDNLELGVRGQWGRGSVSVTLFDNRYEDFIEQINLGFIPTTGLITFQAQNVEAARTNGVEATADAALAGPWSLRGSLAWIEGENRATGEPLNSITPPQGVLGLHYLPSSDRWGASLVGTFTTEKKASDIDRTNFDQAGIPSSEVFDLVLFVNFPNSHLALQAGLYNLTDETYWNWPKVAGQPEGSIELDRYTQPGRSVSVALRWRH